MIYAVGDGDGDGNGGGDGDGDNSSNGALEERMVTKLLNDMAVCVPLLGEPLVWDGPQTQG